MASTPSWLTVVTLVVALFWCCCVAPCCSQGIFFDVIVYGATPAGIAAAVAAANNGNHTVALVEPLTMLGGMGAAGGLGLHDQQLSNLTVVTGLARTWCKLNGAAYGNPEELVNHPDMSVAASSFGIMLDDAKSVSPMLGCRVASASKVGTRVTGMEILCGLGAPRIINSSIVIDASYDADVMVAAGGISYTWGRESQAAFNESLAGAFLHQEPIESFDGTSVKATYDGNSSIIPYISDDPVPASGAADDRLMAFQYRACLTTDTSGRNAKVDFPKPPGYNRNDFLVLQRQINAVMADGRFPDGPPLDYFQDLGRYSEAVFRSGVTKYILCCGTAPVDSDQPNINAGWATANHTARLAIAEAHRYFLQGALYYMANDAAVPAATRKDVARYGLCGDEFVDYGHWPPQLYVRESVRLQGDTILTQNTVASPRSKPDSVSMALWEFDKHVVARYAKPLTGSSPSSGELYAFNEGFFRAPVKPGYPAGTYCGTCHGCCEPRELWFDVPFSAMLPKVQQATNLLVPVALSTSSVAFSATRIETMYMDLGAAAGVAARLTIESSARSSKAMPPVQSVNVSEVQSTLEAQYGQRVRGPWWV